MWWGGLPMVQIALAHELHGARDRADSKIIWFPIPLASRCRPNSG